jgi:hypothetical protein
MIRTVSWLLSFWLALLFVAGHGAPNVPTWLDALAGLATLFALLGGLIAPWVSERLRIGGPVALSIGLGGLWLAGVLTHVRSSLPLGLLLGAIGFLGAGLAATTSESRRDVVHHLASAEP